MTQTQKFAKSLGSNMEKVISLEYKYLKIQKKSIIFGTACKLKQNTKYNKIAQTKNTYLEKIKKKVKIIQTKQSLK